MKVYSDKLDVLDLRAAVVGVPNVFVARIETMERTRLRTHGWKVQLGSSTSRRWRNSGTFGAMTWQDCAPATWDEHGAWMARLFDLDPDAIVANYRGRDDFHRSTRYQYESAVAA